MNQNQSAVLMIPSTAEDSEGQLVWLQSGVGDAQSIDSESVREHLRAQLQERSHQVVFAAPGADVRLFERPVAPEERRHLQASLPFMFEEELSEDIEQMHFAHRLVGKDQVHVAAVRRDSMEHWQAELGEFADSLTWVSEAQLLPWSEGVWTLVCDAAGTDDRVILRYGAASGTAFERALMSSLLEALAEQHEPAKIVIYGSSEEDDRALIPANLRDRTEWRRGTLREAILATEPSGSMLNLKQGDFSPNLPYREWWAKWRLVVTVAGLALVVHLLAGWLDLRQLQRETLELSDEVMATYRAVNPRGAVAQVEAQLRRQLASLRGDAPGASFSEFLAPLAAAVDARDGAVLASLNYSQRSSDLRINLFARNFEDVEALREDLITRGYSAVLESSSRSGEGVRARLRIGGRS
ncbi:MAG: type II secretion system protein GspL [Pseudomonadota bacterium]